MKCPYCDKINFVPEVAFTNAENYGSKFFNVRCKHCKKIVRIYLMRTVVLESVEKTDVKESDFGGGN
jgi:phage FluMu protein Com